jgi:hypothetical protein
VVEAAGSKRRYALFVRRGGGMFFTLRDEGAGLDGGLLFWRSGQGEIARPLGDIVSVNLTVVHFGRQGDFGQCTIGLTGAQPLVVSGSGRDRQPDPARNAVYRDFLRDLHASLIAAGQAGTVRFSAGASPARSRFMKIMVAIMALLMVALPAALLLATREPGMIAATTIGIVMTWGYHGWTRRNAPRDYEPGAIPPDLVP